MCKLGSLGEHKSLSTLSSNLVGSHSNKGTLVHKKIDKRRGKRPTPKRVGVGSQLGMHIKPPIKALDSGINIVSNDFKHQTTSSKYWLAHSGQPGGPTSSDNSKPNHPYHSRTGSPGGPCRPAKIARLHEPFSKQAKACKGNCPIVWTIESFCELCHSV